MPLSISRSASKGASLPYGISVAPVQASEPEGSQVVGDHVVYPGTAQGVDFMLEPLVGGGVSASWQLLSEESPESDALAFTLPEGAVLQMSSAIPGAAEVTEHGTTLLRIDPAEATEADGVTLPVSYSISGNVLTSHVDLTGSVSYPILLDPLIQSEVLGGLIGGGYGEYGGGQWAGWKFYDPCGCTDAAVAANYLEAYSTASLSAGSYGRWAVYAPGWGQPSGSSIARVWLDDMVHSVAGQSTVEAYMGEDPGSNSPVWTNDGDLESHTKPGAYSTDAAVSEDLEFCADWAGGYEGDPNGQPLCNERDGSNYFAFRLIAGPGSETTTNYAYILGAQVWYYDETAPTEVSIANIPSGWVKEGPSDVEMSAKDAGVGVAGFQINTPAKYVNANGEPFYKAGNACSAENGPSEKETDGFTECPHFLASGPISFAGISSGDHQIEATAFDAVGNFTTVTPDPHLYVDHTPPVIALGGSLDKATGGNVGEGDTTLEVTAADGSESAPQSGPRSIAIYVDGTKVDEVTTDCPEPQGDPAAGCYELTTSWAMEGARYGIGTHEIKVVARDWVGNEASKTFDVTVQGAAYEALGPGEVNLQSGNYKLSGTDVDIASADAALSVEQTYESQNTSAGAGGPLGPQWALNLPDLAAGGVWRELKLTADGSVDVVAGSGKAITFTTGAVESGAQHYTAPAGYATYALEQTTTDSAIYKLRDAAGDTTTFEVLGGSGSSTAWPTSATMASGAAALNKVTYKFAATSEGVHPVTMIAPYPQALHCETTLEKGCRELTFNYAESTTATGEGDDEWGDYKGQLTRVYLHAWNPSAGEHGAMTAKLVAQYAYDTKGRLRAEWNPSVEQDPESEACVKDPLAHGCLATVYGYDSEGQVTALTDPGQETWTFTYGTDASESNPGRLIKVLQAPAATGLWKGETVQSTEAPTLTGTARVGMRMGVSLGKWSGDPAAYSFRWERCNILDACSPIPGADNANYTPTNSDLLHTLVAEVVATNGAGSVVATSQPSKLLLVPVEGPEAAALAPQPGWTVDYEVPVVGAGAPHAVGPNEVTRWGQKDYRTHATAFFPPEEPQSWPASGYGKATVYYQDSQERVVNVASPAGGISTSEYESHDNVDRTLSADNRATVLQEPDNSSEEAQKAVEVAEHLSTLNT